MQIKIGSGRIRNIKYQGLFGYFLAFVKTLFTIKEKYFIIDSDGQRIVTKPLILIISNTNQQGYNFTVTPKAKTNDGLLDMFIIENISNIKNIKNIFKIIFGFKFYPSECIYKKIRNLNLTPQKPIDSFQIDGEYLIANERFYKIKLLEKKLQLISPN